MFIKFKTRKKGVKKQLEYICVMIPPNLSVGILLYYMPKTFVQSGEQFDWTAGPLVGEPCQKKYVFVKFTRFHWTIHSIIY